MSYSSEVLADSPLAYWRLGETSGTTAADSSGNNHGGTYAGGPTLGVAGLLTGDSDPACQFDGSNDIVTINTAAWMNVSSTISVEAWIRSTTGSAGRCIIDRDAGASPRWWSFRLNAGKLEFLKLAGGTTLATSPGYYADGKVHHVAATYDEANIRLYADGVNVITVPATGTMTAASTHIWIGQNGANLNFFNGVIDEAAYYAGALSPARITAPYIAGAALMGQRWPRGGN